MRRSLSCALMILATAVMPAAGESIRYERASAKIARLTLPAAMGESWRQVNIGRLQVRTTRKQTAISRDNLPAGAALEVPLAGGGCSLLQVDVGPPSGRGEPDSWRRVTRCSKIVACTSANRASRMRSSALVTGKTGSRIEIRPLLNPAVLVPGSDLPVRIYWEGGAVKSTQVHAAGPEGRIVQATSDGVGIAFLRIPTAGRWTVSFSHRGAVAELIFDVP